MTEFRVGQQVQMVTDDTFNGSTGVIVHVGSDHCTVIMDKSCSPDRAGVIFGFNNKELISMEGPW